MSTGRRHPFWVTNHLANPVLRPLLRGPLGRRVGRRLAVLRYRGRRTGTVHELIVQYVRDGDHLWIMPGQPERKRWWRNMLDPRPVDAWVAGTHLSGVAHVTQEAAGGEELVTALAAYRAGFPRAPTATVMVRVDVDPARGSGAMGTTTTQAELDQRSP